MQENQMAILMICNFIMAFLTIFKITMAFLTIFKIRMVFFTMAFLTMAFLTIAFFTMAFFTMVFFMMVFSEYNHIFHVFIKNHLLTLFHVTPIANLFYVGGGGVVKVTSPSNFVIFKDRDLKFGDNIYF